MTMAGTMMAGSLLTWQLYNETIDAANREERRLNAFIDLGWTRGMVTYVYEQWAKGVDLFTPNGIEVPT